MKHSFLPITKEELTERGIDRPDFLYVIGDAYVDHPSFGPAIISRVLEAEGYTVAILPQPDYRSTEDFLSMGRPKLGVLVSAGNIDSMVAHYTAAKKPRSSDAYTEGGKAGKRPDRATIVYCNRIREAFGDIPLIIGGLEASLRRFAHYDYWDNRVRRSILFDSRADLLLYGMGERQIVELAKALREGRKIRDITEINGSAYVTKERPEEGFEIPDFEQVREDKKAYALSCRYQFTKRERMLQRHMDRWLVVNPPAKPLSTKELDRVYALPYQRAPHPSYKEGVPGITEVKFSIASSRGCFGGCNFCSLAFHQGRYVTARSEKSILAEAERLTKDPDFKGYIHDVGGPTANFRRSSCNKEEPCAGKQCLFPQPCKNLIVDHREYLHLLRQIRKIPGVKKVFVRSGIRYDYLIYDKDDTFFRELCEHHVSGQLKVAPEHISPAVLSKMGKPPVEVYNRFAEKFYKINEELGKKQFLVPYLISSHPSSRLEDAIRLAEYLKEHHIHPEQVQDFYPTPGTVSTCMYHTGLDPMTMKPVFVPKTPEEKSMQRALLQWSRPENDATVRKALHLAGREDLIGYGPKCLIRPKRTEGIQRKTNKTTKPPKGGGRGRSDSRKKRQGRSPR